VDPDICTWTYSLYVQGTYFLGKFPRTVSHPFTRCRRFPPSNTIRRSTIYSDLPLTCTKLVEVDRLGSGVRVSASFQIFALTAGDDLVGDGNCPGGMSGEYVLGNISWDGIYYTHCSNVSSLVKTLMPIMGSAHSHWLSSPSTEVTGGNHLETFPRRYPP